MLTRPNFVIYKGVELNLPTRGTGIPVYDKRAHAEVVGTFTYLLVHIKITSFLVENLSNSFDYYFRSIAKLLFIVTYLQI